MMYSVNKQLWLVKGSHPSSSIFSRSLLVSENRCSWNCCSAH